MNHKIKYNTDNNLHKVFLFLLIFWPILGGIILININHTPPNFNTDVNNKTIFFIYCLFIEVLFGVLFFIFKRRRKKFVAYKNHIITTGKKSDGRICKVCRQYTKPVTSNEKVPSICYAEIEYFDEYQGTYVKRWTEAIKKIPYGKQHYQIEEQDRYETVYCATSKLSCVVYYLENGEFFAE